jgi:hypothetical protein
VVSALRFRDARWIRGCQSLQKSVGRISVE